METFLVVYIIYEMGYTLIRFPPVIILIQIYLFHIYRLEKTLCIGIILGTVLTTHADAYAMGFQVLGVFS